MTTMAVTHPGFPRLPRVDAEVVRQLMRYGVVGALGTAVSTVLYLVFRVWWDAVPANLAALVLSTVLSTEVNRRFTFDGAAADRARECRRTPARSRSTPSTARSSCSCSSRVVVDPTALQESLAVAGASVVGGLSPFVLLRNWVFGGRDEHTPRASGTVAV